jgi:deazaflavin-dependent oxidoreductase (nitroreductase family)
VGLLTPLAIRIGAIRWMPKLLPQIVLEAEPHVTVRFNGRTSEMTARLLEGDDRARAWQAMLAVWPNFAKYEQRTARRIKVFELTPR